MKLSLAKFLNRSVPSASSDNRAKVYVKEHGQARRIKSIKEKNKVSFNSQGMKRKHDCITSGSNEFESTPKYLAFLSDSSAIRPVPQAE